MLDYIDVDDIDFKKFQIINKEIASKSTIFWDVYNNKFYKIFNESVNLSPDNMKILEQKEEKMSAFKKIEGIDFVSQATKLISNKDYVIGYQADYINAKRLYEIDTNNIKKLFIILSKISYHLMLLHHKNGNPVIGDLHFDNFLVDSNGNDYFTDYDSYGINGIEVDNFSKALTSYCDTMNYQIYDDESYDRLSFMLALFQMIFDNLITKINNKDFLKITRLYPVFEKLEEVFITLKSSYNFIPDIPYFHEIIKEEDILKM